MGRGALRARRIVAALALLALVAGCELQETTIVDVQDVLVAEAYALVGVRDPGYAPSRLFVFLSRTLGENDDLTVPGAHVTVERDDGRVFELPEAPLERCVEEGTGTSPGTCYDAGSEGGELRPGDRLALTVALPQGDTLLAETRIPGDFALAGAPAACRIPPDTPWEVRWSRSERAWTYVAETRIDGLDEALAPEGIEAPAELHLVGLSITEADTSIVFPGEFGVFDRFDLDRPLGVRLQTGLPEGTRAIVGVGAADRNYVNWIRGGSFNPSGRVRVPSVRGDGTGVFGSVVLRDVDVRVRASGPEALCPGVGDGR